MIKQMLTLSRHPWGLAKSPPKMWPSVVSLPVTEELGKYRLLRSHKKNVESSVKMLTNVLVRLTVDENKEELKGSFFILISFLILTHFFMFVSLSSFILPFT